jgi:hypothetical protein
MTSKTKSLDESTQEAINSLRSEKLDYFTNAQIISSAKKLGITTGTLSFELGLLFTNTLDYSRPEVFGSYTYAPDQLSDKQKSQVEKVRSTYALADLSRKQFRNLALGELEMTPRLLGGLLGIISHALPEEPITASTIKNKVSPLYSKKDAELNNPEIKKDISDFYVGDDTDAVEDIVVDKIEKITTPVTFKTKKFVDDFVDDTLVAPIEEKIIVSDEQAISEALSFEKKYNPGERSYKIVALYLLHEHDWRFDKISRVWSKQEDASTISDSVIRFHLDNLQKKYNSSSIADLYAKIAKKQ